MDRGWLVAGGLVQELKMVLLQCFGAIHKVEEIFPSKCSSS
jgi:hypothetical protein